MSSYTAITFDPALPWPLLAVAGAIGLALTLFAIWRRARGAFWRLAGLALIVGALLNPSLVEEQRQELSDIATIMVDRSPSMAIGERRAQADQALEALKTRLASQPALDVRVIDAAASETEDRDDGTRLFEPLNRALADVPRERIAGVFMITDGQVHDAPDAATAKRYGGPIHGLLVGQPDERDRRLVVEQAPTYGLVGHEVSLRLLVEDEGAAPGTLAPLTMRLDGGETRTLTLPVGKTFDLPIKLEHGGQTVVELEVGPGERELTLINNRAVVSINGVRDRLRVLLITGEPHAGQRVWRNLLKADPSVDLIHFTILRPAEKQDGTPIRDLSLIAFPIRELFEIKINEFDLIIFDRYRRRGILTTQYFQNIANYVKNGGALLEASGPAFGSPLSLYRTPLAEVLPAKPTGATHVERFKPALTDIGRRHPVTAELPGADETPPNWGAWFRLVDADADPHLVVLSGASNRPALVLDRVGKGRVAQVLSDHGWLWSRGFDGGGPQAELLRRTAHWLMKEPELEEDALTARLKGRRIEVVRRSLEADQSPVTAVLPDGAEREIAMAAEEFGRTVGTLPADQTGIYRFSDGQRRAVLAVGAVNPREFVDVRASGKPLDDAAKGSGGGIRWLKDGLPEIRRVPPGRAAEGRGWLGLVAHKDYAVTGISQVPLLPVGALALALLAALLIGWRREGR